MKPWHDIDGRVHRGAAQARADVELPRAGNPTNGASTRRGVPGTSRRGVPGTSRRGCASLRWVLARRQVLGYPPRGMEQGKTTDPAAWLAEPREQGERDAGNAIMQIQPRAGRPASRRCR